MRNPGGGGGGGDSHMTGVIIILLRDKIDGLVPLRLLKCKMSSIRGMVVPFRVLTLKICEEVNVSQLIWYLLGGKNCSDHA